MVLKPWQRVVRGIVQNIAGAASAVPLIVEAIHTDAPGFALAALGQAVTVSAIVARVMGLSAVNRLLPLWLRADSTVAAAVVDGQFVAGPAFARVPDGQPITLARRRHAAD